MLKASPSAVEVNGVLWGDFIINSDISGLETCESCQGTTLILRKLKHLGSYGGLLVV